MRTIKDEFIKKNNSIKSPYISCIMPIYNSEKFLSLAIDSLLKQTFHDFEVICVDDCSTDTSKKILLDYCEKDNRIKTLFLSRHCGAAQCRNEGLKQSRGQWVVFLDSDDYFYEFMLEKICKETDDCTVDLVVWNFVTKAYSWDYNRFVIDNCFAMDIEDKEIDHDSISIEVVDKIKEVPWNKMAKREMLIGNGVLFQDIPTNNDIFYSLQVVLSSKRIRFIKQPLMEYLFQRENSLSKERLKDVNIDKAYGAGLKYVKNKCNSPISYDEYLFFAIGKIYSFLVNEEPIRLDARERLLQRFVSDITWREVYNEKGSDLCLPEYIKEWWKRVYEGEFMICENRYLYFRNDINRIFSTKGNAKIALWGFGKLGKVFLEWLSDNHLSVDYLIDSDECKQGKSCLGYYIFAYEDVCDEIDEAIVLNKRYLEEIRKKAINCRIQYIGP